MLWQGPVIQTGWMEDGSAWLLHANGPCVHILRLFSCTLLYLPPQTGVARQPARLRRNASELWRPLTECNYAASALLRCRHVPPLALYVPAAMTGVEGPEDRAIRYMGAKLMGPQPAPPCRDRAAARQTAAAAAGAATARATALAYQQQAEVPPSLTQQRPGIPAQVAALQAPVAAALAAAKQLAVAAAAAAPALGGLPRDGSKPSAQSMQSGGGSLHRVPRCLDVPLLSPAGSSDSLSVASSSDSFGGVLRQLAAQGSPRSPECCPLPQPSVSLLRGVCAPNPDKHTLEAPMQPPSQQQYDQLQSQQTCTTGSAACARASARLQLQPKRPDCDFKQQAAPQWAELCRHPAQPRATIL